ncbi:MAG: hypothetical protein ONB44_02015 [candidate division KSB1 bacterium]|nr:hypothetical protein [candidate division KSB1 bacterium]MDZ7309832.1 hypothetical protein [candidate division KSB1 bacterium]
MHSWITLIASIVIGGLVLMSFGQFNNDVTRDLYLDTLDNNAYGNLDEVVRLIEYDFSRIGLGINDPKQAVLIQVDSTDLRYNLDSDGNGVIETMRYYLGSTSEANSTQNPRDRYLYRVVNGTSQIISSGLTDFKIRYYDAAGNASTNLSAIRTFVVTVTMESEMLYDNQYPKMFWTGRITPPSLMLR